MKATSAAIATAATLVFAAPASAQAGCCQAVSAPVVVETGVWVNPGVYVSGYSGVTRNYPYVGCCLSEYENWSYRQPYSPGSRLRTSRIAPRYSHRSAVEQAPRAADHLHYPDGSPIERFR